MQGTTADDERGVFEAVCGHARQVAVLGSIESLLGWDERTLMPPAAGRYRAEQIAALATLAHRARTDPRQRERLALLATGELARSGTPRERTAIRLLHRDVERQARVPESLVEALARTAVTAQQAWVEARAASEWTLLEPHLQRMLELKREQAACLEPDLDPYDALLEQYEPGARWREVAVRFAALREGLVPLVRDCVASRHRPDDAILRRHFPIAAQQAFVREVAAGIGFDFTRGRLDTTHHPFCCTTGPDDCRITTRWDEAFLQTALFGVLHEAGHGLYEQGLPRDWFGLPPGQAASLGIHESQSRLWENLVGRSAAFWSWCHPLAKAAFPDALADVDRDALHRAMLTVQPSFIRVEADEVTYNLHVMLRFDLERALVHGTLSVNDLPAAWNERFEEDFGIRPPDDAHGVLQDIHWSAGLVGYFPTYTLGNLFAAQLMAEAERVLPDLDDQIARGRFTPLLEWLRTSVHARGRELESVPLVEAITGRPVSEAFLLESLRRRYGSAHGL